MQHVSYHAFVTIPTNNKTFVIYKQQQTCCWSYLASVLIGLVFPFGFNTSSKEMIVPTALWQLLNIVHPGSRFSSHSHNHIINNINDDITHTPQNSSIVSTVATLRKLEPNAEGAFFFPLAALVQSNHNTHGVCSGCFLLVVLVVGLVTSLSCRDSICRFPSH
jgi:hypothetical protein